MFFKTNIKTQQITRQLLRVDSVMIKQNRLSYRQLTLQDPREEGRSQNHPNMSSHLAKLEAMPKSN